MQERHAAASADLRLRRQTMTEQKLIDAVLDQIAEDVSNKDFTAIEEMFMQLLEKRFEPRKILKSYLPEMNNSAAKNVSAAAPVRHLAIGIDECGTDICIEIGKLVDIDSLRRKYPECSFNVIKTEDIDHWHESHHDNDYNPQEEY